MMVCCVAAASCWYDVTKATLDFAKQCMKIKLASPEEMVKQQGRVEALKEMKANIEGMKATIVTHTAGYETKLLDIDMTNEDKKAWLEAANTLMHSLRAAIAKAKKAVEV
tara:strand:+ start:630 stop:959 length:330 start_codon:yes stop_codon:yes gene_type:complete